MASMYKLPADERIFAIVPEAVQHVMKRHADKARVKYIRVHDLRHKDIRITLNTYGHLYPSEREKVADMLDKMAGIKENAPCW